MSNRDENRAWLQRESERRTDSWEAAWIAMYGMEGALDLLEAQSGDPMRINLSRRPFCNDEQLKEAVRDARAWIANLSLLANQRWWADIAQYERNGRDESGEEAIA